MLMMKDSTMSVAETEEDLHQNQEISLSKGEDESSPFESMQSELHSKGAVLTKAWSDLFSFITKYQADLVMKENSMEIAEKEIEERKRHLEEMKGVDACDEENLHDAIRANERLLRKAQSELSVKDGMLERVQSDLSSNIELLEKSRCDLLKKENDLVRYKGNVEQLKSELKIKQEQIQIKDNLLKKLQNQLMKDNAELKEQLELERRALQLEKQSHELTKRTTGMSSPQHSTRKRAVPRTTATSSVIETPDSPPTLDLSDDQDFEMSSIVSMAESRTESSEQGRRISSNTDHSSRLHHKLPAYASSQISYATPQKVTHFPKTFIGSTSDNVTVDETPDMTTSDTFFPLSVSEDTKSDIDFLTGMKIDTDDQRDMPQPASPSSGASDNGSPLSIPGSIASPGMSPGGSIEGGADGKADGIGLNLQCDEEEPVKRAGLACPAKTKEDNFVCKICGNSYRRRDNLRRHQRIHFGQMKTCDHCHKQFPDSCDLRRHLQSKHEGIRYPCPQCPKSYCNKLTLQKHIDDHNEIYRFKCPKCPRGFNIGSSFKQHMNRHNGIKPHLCASCGKFFAAAADRNRHYISCANLELYMCSVCGKTFKDIRYFKDHQKYHDDPSSLKCKFCEKILALNSCLRRHMKVCKKRPK